MMKINFILVVMGRMWDIYLHHACLVDGFSGHLTAVTMVGVYYDSVSL